MEQPRRGQRPGDRRSLITWRFPAEPSPPLVLEDAGHPGITGTGKPNLYVPHFLTFY